MVSRFAGPGSLRRALSVAAGPGAQDRKQELSATTCSRPACCHPYSPALTSTPPAPASDSPDSSHCFQKLLEPEQGAGSCEFL